ncbi:Sec-independent protein translocase subunit TatA/TatB [Craterilacuibacter sinensis]|uniref:Sec-independent protein translocase protein TatB n=1 Tax=Craterilacuibacter sinensis TaxID=2686017 RepID=A0A845BIS3_9NEIS|nr:twin-arginine translocase TatA/TatE family subunit [Craterilacuibacter sinensis]MXR36099.1 twin-arginine translocase subunit TatB [Craterilacuibacter sinensis]RQW22189.1 twin-arginine translocase subunit TatB [Rhodobacteraceae bacterium CH30]
MFEISFGEIILISVVALVILGPERLPTVARTLGALVGRAQRFVSSVKADVQQQAADSGLLGISQDIRGAADSFRSQMQEQVDEVKNVVAEQQSALHEVASSAAAPFDEARRSLQPDVALAPAADTDPHELIAAAHRDDADDTLPLVNDKQLDLFDPPASAPADKPSA